ncbi:MAG: hypothetical protein SFV51_14090 [Bryobacteraceae bacterium]|nr:hypothetical protein [Bryobacteraceae bacterium]
MSFKTLAIGLLVILPGCGPKAPSTGVQRVAILPFENLSTDASLDWIGSLAPVIVARQTAGASGMVTVSLAADHDLAAQRITSVVRGYYQKEGSQLRLRAALHDVASARVVRWFDQRGPMAGGPLPLLDNVSRELAGKADPYPSSNQEALAMLGAALASGEAAKRAELAEAAFHKDPRLTAAALEAAPLRAATGAGAEAVSIIEAAMRAASSDWDRAQAGTLLGFLRRDRDQLAGALEVTARIAPANADVARQLGELATRKRDYAKAAGWFAKATDAEPGYIGLWNLRAYAEAYGLNFSGAKQSTKRYRDLAPLDPNAYDTTGEILWMAGEFAEAGQSFVQAQEKDPQFSGGLEFAKAAFSLWMAGDAAAADSMFQRYLESRRALSDPIVDLRHAHWLFLSGRQDQALTMAAKIAGTGGEIGSRALSFVSFWHTRIGQRDLAREEAAKAATLARSPGSQSMAALAGLFAQPKASPAEWQERVGKVVGPQAPASFRTSAVVYALFLDGHYREAAKLLDALLSDATPGTVDELQALLGGAQLLAGDKQAAARTLGRWPLPPQPGESLFASLWFPAVKDWRAQALK